MLGMKSLISFLIAIILILQYKLWFDQGGVPDVVNLKRNLERQVAKNTQLRSRNQALEAEVHNLKQGQNALEERARTDLGMIKDDETFFQILESPKRRD